MFTCNVLSSYATSSHSPEQLQQNKEKCACGKSVLSNRVDENHVPRCSILGSVQYCRMLKRLLKINGCVNYCNFEESLLKRKNPQVVALLMLPVCCWFLNVILKKPFYHSYCFFKKEKMQYVPVQVLIPNCCWLKSIPELLVNCCLCMWDAQKVQKQLLSALVYSYSLREYRERTLEICKHFFLPEIPLIIPAGVIFLTDIRETKKLTRKYMTTISEDLFNVFSSLWLSFGPKGSQLNCCTT